MVRSYVSDRQQLVDVAGIFSSQTNIVCGVPQGSILGPTLFSIYVNDMHVVVKHKLLLYADDSAVFVHGKHIYEVESLLSSEYETVSDWLICNKLSLHMGKTESVLLGSKHKLKSQSKLSVSCKGQPIETKESVKYLGATIDENLSFDSMANSVLKKANARFKFLYRKGCFLSFFIKTPLVMSIIQCHLDYAPTVWFYSITQALRNKLQTTQNKLVKFV